MTEIFGRSLVPLVIGATVACLMTLLIDSSVQVEEVGGQSIIALFRSLSFEALRRGGAESMSVLRSSR